jgi:hypothetical protein
MILQIRCIWTAFHLEAVQQLLCIYFPLVLVLRRWIGQNSLWCTTDEMNEKLNSFWFVSGMIDLPQQSWSSYLLGQYDQALDA